MDWPIILIIIFASLIVVMASGFPIAFCFILVNIVGILILWGGATGLELLISSFFSSICSFSFLPVPMFVLMGEILYQSKIAPLMMDALDKWLGRLPGRLSLLAVGSGAVLSTLTGASMASVAMLGSVLVPEMEKRGYKKAMTLGPIMGSGGLAVMIPPSSLAVVLGAIGQVSIGKILIAIIIPGIIMAVVYALYIILRCSIQPQLAPAYELPPIPLKEKVLSSIIYILPIGLVIFLVIGVMLLGIATPTEAAVTGVVGSLLLAAIYRRVNWEMIKKSFMGAILISVMIQMIIVGSQAFSQIMAFSGASTGLAQAIIHMNVSPLIIIILMQIVIFILGMFLSPVPIMMITLPIFMPVVLNLGFDAVWFSVIFLINLELAIISPPFGLSLFTMKSVAPFGTTMGDVFKSAIAFIILDIVVMAIIIAFPQTALWLPGIMQG